MARQIPFQITELLDLPVAISGVSSALAPLFDEIKLRDEGPGELPPTAEEEQEIEAWFDSIRDWLKGGLPPASGLLPDVLQNAVDFDPDQRQLTLKLANRSERETSLAGMEGLSFVVPVQDFVAIATLIGTDVKVTLSLDLALRLKGASFEPMKSVAGSSGGYEPDAGRQHTDIPLPNVGVAIDSAGAVTFPVALNAQLSQPVRLVAAANLLIEGARLFLDLTSESRALALQWQTSQLGDWLGRLAPNFSAGGSSNAVMITLRLGLGDPLESVRLDWKFAHSRQNYRLPGIAITTPGQSRFTVLLKTETQKLNRFLFILTLPSAAESESPAEQVLTAASSFAWERQGGDQPPQRELQNNSDPNANADADPLFKVDFTPTRSVSLALLDWTLTQPGLPTFLKEVPGGLPLLDFEQPASLRQSLDIQSVSLSVDAWEVKPFFNPEAFDFPFLRNDQRDQRIQLRLGSPEVSLANSLIGLKAMADVRIGALLLNSEFGINFNWETFALKVEHGEGLRLLSADEEIIPDKPYLGLNWRFKGAPAVDDQGEPIDGKFQHLTLVTKDYNYQVVQAPGATIEVDYVGASEDPITFIVSNLAITDKGITLTAEVSDRPAKLNGLDTRFRFHGSRLEIVENRIQDFTLAGSGPLPPDLVGDAIADIALQFSQRGGGLTLVAGAASLRGNQLLSCKGTRFEFSIDALGLKFVNDGRFHLYFTITGAAQFLPLPGDSPNGPLALLTGIKIQLVECPLTSDVSVIGKHVNFQIELPEKVSFSFLGCFEMEIRSIGFVPQFDQFDGAAAMEIGGQVKFAQGTGDVNTVQIDFHSLFVGLPPKGSFFPRIYMQELEVNISLGEAFKLNAVVEFRDNDVEQGFLGEGVVEIPGMPIFAASFAFLRVRRSENEPWVRAWFIFVEARQVSLYIPFVELYIREIGLGFGYRYTIASIKAADEAGNLKELIGNLRELSRTQGDLSKRDRWSVDLEGPGESLRWTIVLRALISQTSATPGAISLKWLEHIEQTLPCLFLFDAIVAFRSDLTFFMAVRAWINSNYYDYVNDVNELRERPLFSGFVLLSVRQKRFLAQISSNPNGSMGTRPPLPTFVEQAILNGQFAATILIEPALLHAELGWPNMLRWSQKIGPLDAEVSGGMIFRVSKHYLVLGISYKARGSLSFDAELNLKIVGVRVSAHASFAWGARFIGVVDLADPTGKSAIYAAIGIEIRIRVSIALWIKLLFIKKTFRLSLEIGFTAGLELGIDGVTNAGVRGSGTLFISAMGRNLQVSVKLGLNEGAVQTALDRTAPFLNLGLEATDVDPVPGVAGAETRAQTLNVTSAPLPTTAAMVSPSSVVVAPDEITPEALTTPAADPEAADPGGADPGNSLSALKTRYHAGTPATIEGVFLQPNYDLFVIRPQKQGDWGYFILLPRAEPEGDGIEELGFLPVPPAKNDVVVSDNFHDFALTLPELPTGFTLQHFRPVASDRWETVNTTDPATENPTTTTWPWRVDWDAEVEQATQYADNGQVAGESSDILLSRYLTYAFKTIESLGQDVPVADPDAISARQQTLTDDRVHNPSAGAYEAAVRGALEQFRSSPFFKHDPNSPYERTLEVAFRDNTSIYTATGESAAGATGPTEDLTLLADEQANQQAHQMRGLIVQDLIADLQDYADLPDLPNGQDPLNLQPKDSEFVRQSIGFQMGLVFRYRGTAPDWLEQANPTHAPSLKQRSHRRSTTPDSPEKTVRTFNLRNARFAANPPQFERVQPLTDTNTIAIAWDLTWSQPPEPGASSCQRDPNHHLLHYQVRRRSLDGSEPEVVYTVKPATGACFEAHFGVNAEVIALLERNQVLTPNDPLATTLGSLPESSGTEAFLNALRENLPPSAHAILENTQHELLTVALSNDGGMLKQLQPRFQIVDHFTNETLADQATMPATGRSYLYTITPIDFTKTPGRPLTLVATRYPSEPPRVPVDGEFRVEYQLQAANWSGADEPSQPDRPVVIETPEVITPNRISLQWSDLKSLQDGPVVPVAKYWLIFRKDITLPIGSYGLDSSTQGPRSKNLPTTNARSLPTDIKIQLRPPSEASNQGNQRVVTQIIDDTALSTALGRAGILPAEETPQWRPEAWQVFLQTESINGVPSALAPVKLLLQFKTAFGGDNLEERQPAQLEWLPKPLRLPMLPPEDSRIVPGIAHVPMPGLDGAARFTGDLGGVAYRPHPAQLTLLRLRWNQGPSNQPRYPLNLNASYALLELDVDAHTNQTFRSTARLAEALREIQQVQLLPAEDLYFTPKDTLAANQWEAWYPSRVRRFADRVSEPVEGDQIGQSPWYSWRESHLVWPDWPTLTDPTLREEALHPFLQALVETLDENSRGYTYSDPSNPAIQKLLPTYNVDVQFGPPRVPGDLKAFQELTAPSADPYGWSILLRLGLSMGLTLRDEGTNDLITGNALLQALQAALTAMGTNTQTNPKFADWLSYLHVELLFQPGQSFSPTEKAASAKDLLAMVQLSLRPRVEPYLTYGVVEIKGPARSQVELQFTLKPSGTWTIIDQSNGAGREQELPPPGQPLTDPVVQTVTLPLNGQTRLLLRHASGKAPTITKIRFSLPRSISLPTELTQAEFSLSTDGGNYLNISPEALSAFQQALALAPEQRQTLKQALVNALSPGFPLSDQAAIQIDALFDLKVETLTPFSPRDERSTYFRVPSGLTADLANRSSELGVQWRQIKLYLESINSTDPTQPSIAVPTDAAGIEKMLPDFLAWSQRFFDASADDPRKVGGTGPWLVTAYPRISTPAYVSPDDSGRLKYDHLITDRWAHNYRYYIRPSSRYDLLWQSLLESPDLFPSAELQPRRALNSFVLSARSLGDLEGKLPPQRLDALYPLENQRFLGESRFLAAVKNGAGDLTADQKTALLAAVETFPEVLPDPQAGGLDVTIDRSQPIDKPLVLSSSRLDAPGTPSNPAAPGRTWEVIVAQHLEQRLVERNQTLVRRLAYRQIAFTLLRSFAYPDWPQQLQQASTPDKDQPLQLELDVVAASYPEVPSTYPEQPDHLNLEDLLAADARSLDLPLRNGNFQQGALVLQWDALPFFYQHRLLLIAQSATTVSEPNELVQRDFEYRTPEPMGEISVLSTTFGPNNLTIRTHQVELPLQRLWDALSPAVQAQWDSDNPDLGVSDGPDPTSTAIVRKPASLPDPEVIYQLVELYSGNLEVQVEYFFDPAKGYVSRQLGQRLLGDFKRLRPPTVANPQANFALETYLHRVQELQLERSGYFDPPLIGLGATEGKVWRRQKPSLFLVGVFNRRDRINLLINSVSLLQAHQTFPGTASALTSPETLLVQEAFIDDWYSTRMFANAPIDPPNLSAFSSDLVNYPEVPKANTIPPALRPKLTILPNQVTWQGTILASEKETLNTYSQGLREFLLPDYRHPAKVAIDAVLAEMSAVTVTAPYDLPALRPHPKIGFVVPGFSIAVVYPPAANPNWTLGWTGPMDQVTENRLTAESKGFEAGFRAGVEALIQQVRRPLTATSEPIPGRPGVPEVAPSLNRKLTIEPQFNRSNDETVVTLTWQGSMADSDVETLRSSFSGTQNLIAVVEDLINQALLAPSLNQRFTETIGFEWPRLDSLSHSARKVVTGDAQGRGGNSLKGLTVNERQRQLIWRGADTLDAAVQELIDLVSNRLQPGDPFISAFAALMRQLERPYHSPMRLNMLRLRGLPSLEQEASLKQLFIESNAATIESLLADIRDRTTIDHLYASGFSQQPISIPAELPASLRELVDFPPPSETVLIWQGGVSAAEQAAALALNGDEAFKAALKQLARPRPSTEDLPEAIRDQLQITPNGVNGETGEQLTWVPIINDDKTNSPTDEQIQILQELVTDAGYEASVRRLVSILLKNRQTTEPVSVPLAALPDLQQLSIPLPAEGSTRPTTNTLPDELKSKLLIGNAVIRYHGLMSEVEGVELRHLYPNTSDKAVIARLYKASIDQGSQGRQVYLQARRGSAAPSSLIELNLPSLPED